MKIRFVLFICCLLAFGKAYTQTSPADAGTAGREFLSALTEGNSSKMAGLLGTDFRLVSFDGQTVDSSTLLEGISGGYVVIESGNIYSHYTRNFQDTGICTGVWDVKGTIEGQSFRNRLAYTLVVIKQGGAWKVVSVQFTPS